MGKVLLRRVKTLIGQNKAARLPNVILAFPVRLYLSIAFNNFWNRTVNVLIRLRSALTVRISSKRAFSWFSSNEQILCTVCTGAEKIARLYAELANSTGHVLFIYVVRYSFSCDGQFDDLVRQKSCWVYGSNRQLVASDHNRNRTLLCLIV